MPKAKTPRQVPVGYTQAKTPDQNKPLPWPHQANQRPIIFFRCLSAHSRDAILPLSAASALALLAASSLSFRSRSMASFSALSRLKICLPLTFNAPASAGVTVDLPFSASMTLLRFAELVDVARCGPLFCGGGGMLIPGASLPSIELRGR